MRRRGIAQNSALALTGDLAAKGGAMAVLAIAARALSVTQFALLATAMAIATILTAALDFGSQTVLTRDGVAGPAARGSLLRALAVARAPLVGLALLTTVGAGVVAGQPIVALATLLLALAGAVQLSLTGALRSAQDLRPEAITKLTAGVLTLVAASICLLVAPSAALVLLALAAANLLALAPIAGITRKAVRPGPPLAPWPLLRTAAPIGAMALATLVYYRSGTIALSLLSTPTQTAHFATASTIAWGMLCVGNAVTTGLLPRLSAAPPGAERAAVLRTSLLWMSALSLALGVAVVLLARPLLVIAFGPRYGDAAGPLMLLAAATVLIGPAGILGTALIADGRLAPLSRQVAVSLAVNLAALAALAPTLGADGAGIATLACEVTALLLLAWAVYRRAAQRRRLVLVSVTTKNASVGEHGR